MRPSRRDLMRMLAAGAMLPAGALASSASERKFLFLFVSGGWDPTWVFTPDLDDPAVWRDPNGEAQEAGGIRFFDGPGRPNVSAFFQHWGDRCAIINGMEVRSVTHDACRRIVLTGSTAAPPMTGRR